VDVRALDTACRHDHDRTVSAQAETAESNNSLPQCWCCGGSFAEPELVHLGSHPEVGLCADCAHWVHRRAAEQAAARRGGLPARYRGAFAATRSWVIQHEVHNLPVLGRLLRGLDRRLP
jgi:hypothetical protein